MSDSRPTDQRTTALRRTALRRMLGLAAASTLVVACAGSTSLPSEFTGVVPETTPTPTTLPPPECTDAAGKADNTPTYTPLDPLPAPDDLPSGSRMQEIRDSGRLVVGVSGDTLLFGARNPFTQQIEGFDIDILREVERAIFGDTSDDHIEFRVITYADRLPNLESGAVDVVAHTMTINCRRWLRINFSSVYYQAGQKVLVKKGSGFTDVASLDAASARVCAPEGSTNIDEINNRKKYPNVIVVGKPDISDCLVAMQQGLADATTGDDTVLAGFAVQDPNTEVVGDAFTEEPYGLGFNKADVELTQFVNAVLAAVISSGRWQEIADTWLINSGALTADAVPALPSPVYARDLVTGELP